MTTMTYRFVPLLALSTLFPVADATAGDPFVRLPVVFVCDSSTDAVWRLVDLDGDGTMNGDGEATIFYDDAVGPLVLGNPCAMAWSPTGVVYVNDSTQDQVLWFRDLNGDGDAHDLGEHGVFFDGTTGANAAGLTLSSSFAMDLDDAGRLWLTNSDQGSATSPDCIFWIEDVNADGDAMDAGESQVFHITPSGGNVGDSAPTSLRWGQDGRLYYVENGHAGFQAKGIYVVDDLNSDGFIDPLTEFSLFYATPSHPVDGAYYVLHQTDDGHWLLPDLSGRDLWRLKDGNGDGVITHEWEVESAWSPPQSQVWGIDGDGAGGYFLAESSNPDRVIRLEDTDGNGVFAGPEVVALYADNASSANIAAPRAITVGEVELPGAVVCGGGDGIACPCGNDSDGAEGCRNSTGAGAELTGYGVVEVSADDYRLLARGLPANRAGVFLQGALGAPIPFRDGALCAVAPTERIETVFADAAGCARSSVSLSAEGFLSPGDQRVYQLWYRDPGGPCGAGSNVSGGWLVDWE